MPLATQMQQAFSKFLGIPVSQLVRPSKKPMWNASVSFKTYKKLQREGVLA